LVEQKEDQNSFEFISFTEFSENVKKEPESEVSEIPSIENVENVEIVESEESEFVNVENTIEKNEDELFDEILEEPLEQFEIVKLMETLEDEFNSRESMGVSVLEEEEKISIVKEEEKISVVKEETVVEEDTTIAPVISKGETETPREIAQETFELELNFYSTLLPWRPEFNILT
jgi:hypothetical protein